MFPLVFLLLVFCVSNTLSDRPYALTVEPPNRKFNAPIGRLVSLYFCGIANPTVTSHTNWSFVNIAGQTRDLPANAVSTFNLVNEFSFTLAFNLTSDAFYGNYSITVTNSVGSTTETFQVLRPGPPDAPANFAVQYVSHDAITFQWLVMWDNGSPQTIFLQINAVGDETVEATWNSTINTVTHTITKSHQFSDNIHPETDYEARIWSRNVLGSSEVVKLTTRTPKQMILPVSTDKIFVKDSKKLIDYSTSHGNSETMAIKICVKGTENCEQYSFDLSNNDGRNAVFNNLPQGNEYVIDFNGYAGTQQKFSYRATMSKGIRTSRTGDYQAEVWYIELSAYSGSPVIRALCDVVIVLGVLVLVGYSISFLVQRCRCSNHPTNKQVNGTLIRGPDSYEISYIGPCKNKIESKNGVEVLYTALDKTEAKVNRYS